MLFTLFVYNNLYICPYVHVWWYEIEILELLNGSLFLSVQFAARFVKCHNLTMERRVSFQKKHSFQENIRWTTLILHSLMYAEVRNTIKSF